MFQYYFMLGVKSLRRNPALTALMVLILAIGVAASVSTLTILHVMSGDPIPQKSDRLLSLTVDVNPKEGYVPGQGYVDHQLTYKDVQALLKSKQGERRAGMYGINAIVEPARKELGAMAMDGIAASADFFAMLDVPFLYGQAWQASEDNAAADVVVLNRKMAEKIFGNVNPVGQRVRMMNGDYTVVGVMNDWKSQPRFFIYNGRSGAFSNEDEFIIPLSNAIRRETPHSGSMSCSSSREPGWQALLDSECTWFHFWFELKSASQRQELQSYLDNYVSEQQKLGRFPRHAPNRIFNVREWLIERKLIGDDSKISAWLAFGFLLLCLVNTIGLLLAKFSVRASEVGVRRALGASRREIFSQFLIEAAVVGLVGAIVGVVLALGALQLIAMQSRALAAVAHMDWQMLGLTFLMSVGAAILAGLLPTWRACQVTPAIQLKLQ
ncbi:ABC transporter permease [Undibacterium fentianense]|uniref:ABC transporter permease n=1 Tax=Undibacterium fentianense TaxID=2828728 RepID=A0A941E2E8_9BURK|nr:ABC transporter permease [Undibacterium fentianense]MBR7799751.1 ABC transporter permease [Undibacterium fentianense]